MHSLYTCLIFYRDSLFLGIVVKIDPYKHDKLQIVNYRMLVTVLFFAEQPCLK